MHIHIRTSTHRQFAALRAKVEKYREITLGRLARRVHRADLTLEKKRRADGTVDHLCELEVHTGNGKPLRLRYRSRDADEALRATFQRAKAELIRRARAVRSTVTAPTANVLLPA